MSKLGCAPPGLYPSRGQKRDESGVNASSIRDHVAARQQAELELRVGDDDAARFGVGGALRVKPQRQVADAVEHALADDLGGCVFFADVDVVAGLAFVAGVKMGSGRRSDSFIPLGSRMPHTSPVAA